MSIKIKIMNFKPYNYTEEELQSRIEAIVKRQSEKSDRREALKTIFQSIDFTTLEAFDNAKKIEEFCAKAIDFQKNDISDRFRQYSISLAA